MSQEEREKKLINMAPDAAHRHFGAAHTSHVRRYQQRIQAENRSIAPIPPIINMRRRAQGRYDLKAYCEHYFSPIFYYSWSADQLTLISELERVILDGSNKAVAMPRGGGKSSLCTIAANWAVSYGHRQYIYLIRDTQNNAESGLLTIRRIWEQNDMLLEDFPEIAWPVRSLQGSHLRAKMQTYGEERTYIDWSTSEAHFPILFGYPYLEIDARAAGAIISTCGITSGIRGANFMNPYTGEIIRPDLVILDDVQTDAVAASPTTIEKYIDLIDGAIKGLSGPGKTIAGIMPCTVINDGDVSDTYLSPLHKPEWRGQRGSMVLSWPEGITDTELTDESVAGQLWNEYARIRIQSLLDHGDIRDATAFYGKKKNRKIMDKGFEVSWYDRYIKEGNNRELSAQQHAMNLRLENIWTFLSEYQNAPAKSKTGDLIMMPTPGQVAERVIATPRCIVPYYCNHLVGMIDIQDEMLWYVIFACDHNYSGAFVDYGIFPTITHSRTFTKTSAARRKEMSHAFFKAHPDFPRDFSLRRDKMKQAPFEAKIRWGIEQLVAHLTVPNRYTREDGQPMPVQLLAIDCKWGASSDIVIRTVAELGDVRLVPYEGTYVGASSRQLGEWSRKIQGRVFEDQVNPLCQSSRWIKSPVQGTMVSKLFSDVNVWKTFLMNRFTCPKGGVGAVQMYQAHPAEHDLFAQHIAKSEYPLPVTARGRTVLEWKELTHGGWPDNDLLDCATGCMVLASLLGCHAPQNVDNTEQVVKKEVVVNKRSMSQEAGIAQERARELEAEEVTVDLAPDPSRLRQTTTKPSIHHTRQRQRRSMAEMVAEKRKARVAGSIRFGDKDRATSENPDA